MRYCQVLQGHFYGSQVLQKVHKSTYRHGFLVLRGNLWRVTPPRAEHGTERVSGHRSGDGDGDATAAAATKAAMAVAAPTGAAKRADGVADDAS